MIWYVAFGSAVGGVSRFLLATWLQQRSGGPFPIGTLVVNVTGSLLLGFLLRYALQTAVVSPEIRVLLTTGFCGGYTTFSTFTYETVALVEEGDYRRATLYVLASIAMSLAGAFAGFTLASRLAAARHDG